MRVGAQRDWLTRRAPGFAAPATYPFPPPPPDGTLRR